MESQKDLCDQMRAKFSGSHNVVINATVWSSNSLKKVFYDNLNTQSSSLYQLGTHKESYSNFVEVNQREVITSTLDSLQDIPNGVDFINLDIQGAELEALKGAKRILGDVSWIYTEINRKHVYQSCPLVKEIDDFLRTQGFRRVATRWAFGEDWGDALYSRKRNLKKWLLFLISENVDNVLMKIRYKTHDLKKFLKSKMD